MSEDELYHKLMCDLNSIHLPVSEVEVEFRPYSVTYYGRYFPKRKNMPTPKMYLYPYDNEQGDFMSYDKLLETAIHEFIHHIQYSDPNFRRKKGVMHNVQFWKLYNHYIKRAEKQELMEEDKYVHK